MSRNLGSNLSIGNSNGYTWQRQHNIVLARRNAWDARQRSATFFSVTPQTAFVSNFSNGPAGRRTLASPRLGWTLSSTLSAGNRIF